MSALIVYSSDLAEFRRFFTSCDFDDLSLEDRVAVFAKHHKLDANEISRWRNYTLRDWIASTDHVLTWVYLTRFLGPVGRILALKVGLRAAHRALAFWEGRRHERSPREVIEYVEELVKVYEDNEKNGRGDSVTARSLRRSSNNLAVYVSNNVSWSMSISRIARAGCDVVERLGMAAGEDPSHGYCLAESIMGVLRSAAGVYKPDYVQTGLMVYSKPESNESDQYKAAEQARQRADFLAVLDEIEGVTASKPERANP